MNSNNYFLLLIFLLFTVACSNSDSSPPMANQENPSLSPPTVPHESYLLYKDFPSKYVDSRNIEVWLPEKYALLEALPVLYMFDGQNIFHGTKGWSGEYNEGWQVDATLASLNKAGKVPEVIVVGIFNNGAKRAVEYMPAKPTELVRKRIAETEHEWYKHFKEQPLESNELLQFIVEELKPFIDQNFKTKPNRANTFVGGSSFGGMISAYAICEYPEIFGGAACFSTHWLPLEGVFLEYIKENLPDPDTHKIYFDYGTKGLDAEYEPFQMVVDSAMQERGYEERKNWRTIKFEGQDHHERDWRNRFHIPMRFLIGNRPLDYMNYRSPFDVSGDGC